MKVSIIMSVYQAECYLEDSINSIVNQTMKDFEFIIVNDGSTDNSQSIIDRYKQSYKNIKSVYQCNSGITGALNTGLQMARGEYILFVDCDDRLQLTALEILYATAVNQQADIILFNAIEVIEENEYPYDGYIKRYEQLILNDPLKAYFRAIICEPLWCKFVNRQYIENNQVVLPANICLCADTAVSASLLMYHPKIYCLDESLYFWIYRSNSTCHGFTDRVSDFTQVISFITEQLYRNQLFEIYYEDIKFYTQCIINSGMNRVSPNNELQNFLNDFYVDWKKRNLIHE